MNSYCGSLFIGHCASENVLDHYKTFTEKMNLDSSFLLHLGMDGTNVTLLFEEKRIDNLKGETGQHILKLGCFSPHLYSSARREDCQGMEELTNVTSQFSKKHVDTKSLSMKLACVRVLEQWDNLCEYFLTFLPTQKSFKREILPTMLYKRIKAVLENTTTQAYISFCSYVAQDFENFLQTFQENEPMIHMLYPEIYKLLTNLMSKFIQKNILLQNSQENVGIDVLKVDNHKSKKNVEIGVKARLILGDPNLVSSENQDVLEKLV